ncbi:MAG: RidA family protein [Bacteroidales bacterium]
MKIIETPNIPPAKGHYSHCIEHNGVLYISGQLPVDPQTQTIPEGIEAQTLLVLKKIEQILLAAGSSKEKVIQMRIYIPNVELWGKVNELYGQFFGEHKPARCVVPSEKLHYDCMIEAEAIAHI